MSNGFVKRHHSEKEYETVNEAMYDAYVNDDESTYEIFADDEINNFERYTIETIQDYFNSESFLEY